MKNKIYDLKNKRAYTLEDAEKMLDAGKMDEYNAKMEEVKTINGEIEAQEILLVEKGRFEDKDQEFVSKAAAMKQQKDDEAISNQVDAIRGSNEYTRAFAKALSDGHTLKSGRSREDLAPLYNALTVGGGNPAGTDGGFLVPIDIDNSILETVRSMTNLADYVTVENVSTMSGWRAMETSKAALAFASIDEMAAILDTEMPEFKKVEYTIKKYGGKIPISNELLSDEVANLMAYLGRWLGRKQVLTNNSLILAEFNELSATPYVKANGIETLKETLNVSLDPDISRRSVVITNQDGFNFLDQLNGSDGRPLLQPDPTNATVRRVFGRQVVPVSNALMPNRVDGSDNFSPIYVGDPALYTTMFRRKAMEVASTNVGAGAFETDSTVVRALMRMDVERVDTDALKMLEIEL